MSGRSRDEERDLSTDVEPKASATGGSPDELRILEAVLFASDELMNAAHLKTILPSQPDARRIRSMVEKLNVQLQKERHPFEVVEIGGGYQFRTITYYHPWVRQIFKEKAAKKLSIQGLECLAIIAYKQPISKAEIEAIRGVVSDGAMKTLLEKRLVTITGRSEKPGRPLLYGTTQTFLKYFGLNRREDLPRIEEFEAMAREKMEELSIDDLEQEEIDQKVEAVGDGEIAESPASGPEESSLFEVSLTEEKAEDERSVDAATGVEDTQPVKPTKSETVKKAADTEAENAEVEAVEAEDTGIAEEPPAAAVPTTEGVADQDESEENEETIEIAANSAPDAPEEATGTTGSEDEENDGHAGQENMYELETTVACLADIEKKEPAPIEQSPEDEVEVFEIGEVAADAPVAENTVQPSPEETAAFEVLLPESEAVLEQGDSGAPEEKPETSSAEPEGKKTANSRTPKKKGRKTTAGGGKASGAKGASSSRTTTRKKKGKESGGVDQQPASDD